MGKKTHTFHIYEGTKNHRLKPKWETERSVDFETLIASLHDSGQGRNGGEV